jgi:UPF0755 protein
MGAGFVSMRRLLLALAVLLAASFAALAAAYYAAERWYRAPLAGLTAPVTIEIAPGEPLGRVAEQLASRGVLDHPRLLAWLARRYGKAARVQAGEYALAPGASPAELLEQWVEGRVVLHPVTLVEGWTVAAALEALHANPVLKQAVAGQPDAALMARLGSPGVAAEGEFFPDTYLVPKGATDLEVLRLAHARLKERLGEAWQRRRDGLPLAGPYEALILASIIEKETGDPEERPHIAAVFVNRLRRGMRLQTDPTVIYGLGAAYDGSIHRRDLVADTPYNTYTRDGLPPTPIALASGAALEAAVRPADSLDLYFVATGRGDGRHEFSATLEAHNAAVARYLERLRHGGGGQR